jgi:hypothetical protein
VEAYYVTATIAEKFDSPQVGNTSAKKTYVIEGTTDELEAKGLLIAESPAGYEGMVRQSYEVRYLGDAAWEGVMSYAVNPPITPPSTGQNSWTFDTAGGTQHIVASKGTTAFGTGAAAGDNGNLINATKQGADGIDITVPQYSWSETYYLDDSAVTGTYKATLYGLTGRTNAGGFRGFAAGEVLFLGASGSKRGVGDWEITFRFSASPNLSGLTVGTITGIAKKGWEYLWVKSVPTAVGSLGVMSQKPVAVYVEKVYDAGDYSGLAIGN